VETDGCLRLVRIRTAENCGESDLETAGNDTLVNGERVALSAVDGDDAVFDGLDDKLPGKGLDASVTRPPKLIDSST